MFDNAPANDAVDRELRGYLSLLIEEKLAAGLSPEAARRQALIELGGATQVRENVRDVRRGAFLELLLQDIRHAGRSLRRTPSFTLVALLTLAIGIGASAAVFTVVNGVLLRQVPVDDPAGLMVLSESNGDRGLRRPSVTGASLLAWQHESTSLRSLAAYLPHNVDLTGDGEPVEVVATDVSRDFFKLTGAHAVRGRLFVANDFAASSGDPLILDEAYWITALGRDTAVLGRSLTVDGTRRTVVGIASTGWPTGVALYSPMSDGYLRPESRTQRVLAVGRLRSARDAAVAELTAIAKRVHATDAVSPSRWAVDIDSALDTIVGNVRRTLYVLLAAVGCVLLIVLANVSSLFVARASARVPEIALRNALGASRGRIMQLFLIEGLIVTIAGSALGVAFAFWGIGMLKSAAPASIPRLDEVAVNTPVLVFSIGLALLAGVFVALTPAFRASGWCAHEALRSSGRVSAHGKARRSVLVVAEIAFAAILLVATGLAARSLINQANIPLGFDASGLLVLDIDIPAARVARSRPIAFVQQLEGRLRGLPGVVGVGTARAVPFESFGPTRQFQIEGRAPIDARQSNPSAFYTASTPGYLPAMRAMLVRGRYLEAADDDPGTPLVVVINETMAGRYWGNENPIGARLRLSDSSLAEVIGVVRDLRQRQLTAEVSPAMWVSWSHAPDPSMLVVIRSDAPDPLSLFAAAQRAVWFVDPMLPVESRTMTVMRGQAMGVARLMTWLFTVFAMIAVVLAGLGVYALVAYSVSLRTREIGVRMALGAEQNQLQRMFVGDGLRLAAIGLTIGLTGALAGSRIMESLLYQVPARDLSAILGAAGVLCVATLSASWLPARRATRIAPSEALR